MSALLDRRSYDPRSIERRRIAIALIILLLASAVWHLTRPHLLYPAACSSVGCYGRDRLIAAALRRSRPDIPSDEALSNYRIWASDYALISSCTPEPGWIRWQKQTDTSQDLVVFADHLLQVRGISSNGGSLQIPPGDMDGDGRWEVACEYQAIPSEPKKKEIAPEPESAQSNRGWAVIRLGEQKNEIAWLAVSDFSSWDKRSTRIKPMWRDEDGDGVKELVFVTVVAIRLPKGIGFKPPEAVAVFKWDRPGGVLRPQVLPKDGELLPWNPPEGKPVSIAPEAELDDIAPSLLPVPADFGRPKATQPATTTQTEP